LESAIQRIAPAMPVVVSLPTLPFAPAFYTSPWEAGDSELQLREELFGFARRLKGFKNVRILSPDWTADSNRVDSLLDIKSELLLGSPYRTEHADRVAEAFARTLAPSAPLKGIITDLDNTFWHGIVGEVGKDAVRWDPATRYHLHGMYQKLLSSLADDGVLVAIASKNDPAVVADALKRADLIMTPDKIFPVEVAWTAKSESVSRILRSWNVSADAVAFIDDTPLELAEVAQAHPGITTIQFPAGDYEGVLNLLKRLRGLYSKGHRTEEDALRLQSLRSGAAFQTEVADAGSTEAFLSEINAVITFDFDGGRTGQRALELINKTNQFNLNGRRYSQSEWDSELSRSGAFLATVKYEDKFGPLGIIAVLQGYRADEALNVKTWVMSCRAFSRMIEHQSLNILFDRFDVSRIGFDFAATNRNSPLQSFFRSILNDEPRPGLSITRDQFRAACPELHHRVEEIQGVA
jgi:FkbH-like protein